MMMIKTLKKCGICFLLCLHGSLIAHGNTEPQSGEPTRIKVEADATEVTPPTGSLPNIYRNKIYKGKKSSLINLQESAGWSEANNTRNSLQQTSGVIVSDVNNQSYYSIGIRGIGDPHESQSVLIMSDDIPVAADFYGYPAVYFLPSLSSVESIEVTKTGAGLLYGSQPGGSLNYRLKQPQYNTAAQFKSHNTIGSNSLLTTFNSVEGGRASLAYRLEGYQRKGDGQFRNSSDFNAYGFDSRLRYRISSQHEIKNQISFYRGVFSEPGGLALSPTAGAVSLQEDRKRNTLSFDELLIDRLEGRISHEYKNTESRLNVTNTLWLANMSRESRRQNGSGFGVIPTNTTNSIQDQDFYSGGLRSAAAKDYNLAGESNTLTASITYYKMHSPIEIGTGSSPNATQLTTLDRQLSRHTESTALALENQFNLGALAITPGVRAESIKQSIDEKFNGTGSLRKTSETDNVILGGLSAAYTTESQQQIYASAAEGFRPIQYSETVPTSSNVIVNGDLKSSKTLSTELGIKGQIENTSYDASVFYVNYKNQVGTVTGSATTNLGNVGEGRYEGYDISVKQSFNEQLGAFANAQFLKARFSSGPLNDKTPAYAPGFFYKAGLSHSGSQFKNFLSATFVKEHYSDDSNTPGRKIPYYSVWDYSGDYTPEEPLAGLVTKLNYGINNLFDHQYYSRVRATGIEPALERNYYAGIELTY